MDYVLITPVRNEAKMLSEAAECILRQTRLPVFWVIIDGNSSDGTVTIAEKLANSNQWIKLKKQENFSNRGGHINFSLAVQEAYEYIRDLSIKKGVIFSFIGKLDADQIIPPNFFEYLVEKCTDNPELGVVSGKSYSFREFQTNWMRQINYKHLQPDQFPEDEIPDKRLYRRDALDDIGGFPITKYSPDTVILAKFRMRGWKIKSFPEIQIINLRKDTGIERDLWKSSLQLGKARYYLGYHPFLLLMGCGYVLLNKEVVKASGIFFGYLISLSKKEEIIDDEEVWKYFRYRRIQEIIIQYLSNFRRNGR